MTTTWTKEIEGTDVTFEMPDNENRGDGAPAFIYSDSVFYLLYHARKEFLSAARIHTGGLYAIGLNLRVLRNATHAYNCETKVWELIKS